MIEPERIQMLNDRPPVTNGHYVLYWMQQSQRESHNPSLEYAIREANRLNRTVIVLFVLMEQYPEANERHFTFMLQGLREVAISLSKRGVPFVLRRGNALDIVPEIARNAFIVVCDRGYLRHQREWRAQIAQEVDCPVIQVEGDVVVPVDLVTDRAEYAAWTIRPKILRVRDDFLRPLPRGRLKKRSESTSIADDFDPCDTEGTLARLDVDRSVGEVARFKGGTTEARKLLRRFANKGLVEYSVARNDPADPRCSTLSPYLHFGQISPVEASLTVRDTENCSLADREAFLEQLVVRRELSINFVLHQRRYDQFLAVPEWARRSLRKHEKDKRPYTYSTATLEAAETHDPYWNAATLEMLKTGFMHNYMRMYWGKKIIEWSPSPQHAYHTILQLNNKYFVDGRDPNSYTSVAWLFGLHDRPWAERNVFGKVRYMNAAGLERKFDIKRYVQWVDSL
jgi:deoxyribodipyrimidine photo-lyase